MNNTGGKQVTITPEQIREWLEELGSTADEVAASLESRGIRGRRGSATHCPIAKYLQQRAVRSALVGADTVHVDPGLGLPYVDVRTPNAVADFVAKFDQEVPAEARAWPNLEVA